MTAGALYEVIVVSNGNQWIVSRSLRDFKLLDQQIHYCVFDQNYSLLCDLNQLSAEQIKVYSEATDRGM